MFQPLISAGIALCLSVSAFYVKYALVKGSHCYVEYQDCIAMAQRFIHEETICHKE
jgi:hypothetical protein